MGWLSLGFWFEVWWVEVALCNVGVMYVYRMCVCGVRLCVLGSSHGGNVGWLGLGFWFEVWWVGVGWCVVGVMFVDGLWVCGFCGEVCGCPSRRPTFVYHLIQLWCNSGWAHARPENVSRTLFRHARAVAVCVLHYHA